VEIALGLIGLLSYLIIFLVVLILVFIHCDERQRSLLSSVSFLLIFMILIFFINVLFIQLIFMFIIIVDILFIIYGHLLPNFYAASDSVLFFEREKEVWEDLKVNETIKEKSTDK